jgi:hypothetical protein
MKQSKRTKGGGVPPGVWSRGSGRGPANPIRIRTKRLDEINSDKLALAYWLLAKQIAENKTGKELDEAEVRRIADQLDDGMSGLQGAA